MRKPFLGIILAAALGGLVAGSAWAAVTARLGHAMPENHPQARAMNRFVELVRKYTDDNVHIRVFHGAALGSDEKMLQDVQSGSQEFYIGTLAPFSARVKEVQVWDLPFLFANTGEVYALFDGPSCRKIFEKFEPIGVVGLMWTGMGFRNLSNSKHPVTKLQDIGGLKIRVMANPVSLETWKTLGASAVPMAYAEVFSALEAGVIDGQENPLVHMYANRMQDVQKYISLTNHVYTPVGLIASRKFWEGLSAADRQGVQKAANEVAILQRQFLEADDRDVIRKFGEAGVRVDPIPPAELALMRNRVRPVIARFAPQIGEGFLKEFLAEIDRARAAR